MLWVCVCYFEDYHLCDYRLNVNANLQLPMPPRLKSIYWIYMCVFFILWTILHWYANICVVIGCSSIGNFFLSCYRYRYRWWSTLSIELLTESISLNFFFIYFCHSSKKESNLVWALAFLFLFLHSFDHVQWMLEFFLFILRHAKNEKGTMTQ